MSLTIYNTLTRRKEAFEPIDPQNVRMYVCGPTVYDYAHIGNARPIIVFDVLFRLLRHVYGAEHVTYARNITDVDDKINARAVERFPDMAPTAAIRKLTEETAAQFHEDIAALGVLPPSVEPRATEHIAEMKALCEALVAKGHAYVAQEHVLFDAGSMADYGRLANRSLEEMEHGARVDVAPYKKGPMDFVLWKPSTPDQPGWASPCGIATPGRPGWHIECSAMAGKHLGQVFDIHGGGIDLVFPHHENEIAQSRCAHGTPVMARYWMHNGFLQVEGEKMSKSLGNFFSINELLQSEVFGKQRWHGRVLRFAMLSTHYRQPIDWTVDRVTQAKHALQEFAELVEGVAPADTPYEDVVAALSDDLNTPSAISILHGLAKSARRGDREKAAELSASLAFMGLYGGETPAALSLAPTAAVDADAVQALVDARTAAKQARDFKEADRLRDELVGMGIVLKDSKDGTTWELKR
ncbi:MAG: cysteine--tRNA ligase [Hyphomicrobiaceae bacterium]